MFVYIMSTFIEVFIKIDNLIGSSYAISVHYMENYTAWLDICIWYFDTYFA
jgi:hypothetical protein